MDCPGCKAVMENLFVDGVLGRTEDVEYCLTCRAFWFEQFETLHLTRGSTLQIIKVIGERAAAPAAPLPATSHCPRCGSLLLLTHDRQRGTSFQYWRCDKGHGRFTAFIDFLREKDFVRPLTPEQMKELRDNLQSINCSQCGGSIDLTHDTACPHCGAALSILDAKKIAEIVHSPDVRPPTFSNGVAKMAASRQANSGHPSGLVESGLHGFMQWLIDVLSSDA